MDFFKKIKQIEAKAKAAAESHAAEHSKLMETAFKTFSKIMATATMQLEVNRIVAAVEGTQDLTGSESSEWLSQWIREDFHALIDARDSFQQDLLRRYFQENHNVDIDFKNSVALYDIGPCLVIDAEDGDIYDQDSSKVVIKRAEYLDAKGYENHDKRNALIEAYMESSGVFPSVVKIDRYGNAAYVSTQPAVPKAA